ncbi:hypothetical protein EMN47_12985 [Prolixibacteraceae bacterium JC049]|nr:hypothetical protein [Prolixibacteraceae bacterium JC049]
MEQLLNSFILTATVIALIWLFKLNRKQKFNTRAWVFSLLATILIPFGLSWGVTSFFEGEPQAGWVGIFSFCGLGVVSTILAIQTINPNLITKGLFSIPDDKVGFRITAIILLLLGFLSFPASYLATRLINQFSDKSAMNELILDNVISDESLPLFIKKTMAYQKRYYEHPGSLKKRLMQGMIAGVTPEGMNDLTNMFMPENERAILLHKGINSIEQWLITDQNYPKFRLAPMLYAQRAEKNTEQLVRWVYANISMPPMKDSIANAFRKGQFSSNMEDYMGTPPEDIKESLIQPLTNIIRNQIKSAEIPKKIELSETLKQKVTTKEMQANKKKMRTILMVFSNFWIISLLLITAGFALVFIARFNWIKCLSWSTLLFGLRMIPGVILFSNSNHFIRDLIPEMVEKVPAPALAFINFIIPQMLTPIGTTFKSIMITCLLIGGVGIAYTYRKFFHLEKPALVK